MDDRYDDGFEETEDTSLQMERLLIASVLTDRDSAADAVEIVTPEDFHLPATRAAFRAIGRCWERREPPDAALVADEIAAAGETYPDIGELLKWTLELFDAGLALHARYYAVRVRKAAERRRFIDAFGRQVADLRRNPELDTLAAMQAVTDVVMEGAGPIGDGPRPFADLAPAAIERMRLEQSGELVTMVSPTGHKSLDDILGGGFWPSDLIGLAARPGMGKTALAAEFMHAAATVGNVLMFSVEMTADQVTRRSISREATVEMPRGRAAKLTPEQQAAFVAGGEAIAERPIWIDDTIGITMEQVLLRTQRLQREGPVSLVVVDYLELVGDGRAKQGQEIPTSQRISEVTVKLKNLARICNVPVLAISQVSRDVELRDNKMPTLADLRWSAMIEQTADVVLMMYRHDYYVDKGMADYDQDRAGVLQVQVAKHRHGEEGMVELGYDMSRFQFTDITGRDHEREAGEERDPWYQ